MHINPKIKICGITTIEEIKIINKFKIDYIGFVFARSKRQVDKEYVKEMINNLRKNIKTVGVFVNEKINIVNEISDYLDLDIVQLHGNETVDYIEKINRKVWKGISLKNYNSLDLLNDYTSVEGILIDANIPGSGKSFNWKVLENIKFNNKFILAGGLNVENIEEAIKKLNPDVVDISTGLEKNGKKDEKMIRNFMRRVNYE
jgi:phosphoribosylanthranilate isomerase